jgi:lipopolysaccharide transport protein LptA
MTGPRAPRPPFQTLRRALLAAAVLVVAAVAGLYLLGRRAQPGLPGEPEGAADRTVDREAGAFGQGFEYEQRIGERSAFRLEGDEFQRGLDEVVTLRGVVLDLTREDGSTYRIESRDAIWDPNVREARLSGDVRLAQGEFRLASQRLDLVDGGRTVISKGPVQLGFGRGIEGRATGLRYDAATDRFQLKGRVRIAGTAEPGGPALALEAGSVNYDRAVRLLRAVGNVTLVHGADLLNARAVDLILDAAERAPRRAIARGEVSGRVLPGEASADAAPVRFEGGRLEVDFTGEPVRASKLDLRGAEGSPGRIQFPAAGGTQRVLVSPSVVTDLVDGRPQRATARGGVLLREGDRLASERTRRDVVAQTATATFAADGAIDEVDLEGGVEVEGPDFEATGERGEIRSAGDLAILRGTPRSPASARTPRGVFHAPEIRYARTSGVVRGIGGVRAELDSKRGGPALAVAGGARDEPVRVEAREADWNERDGSWSFRGNVQAVQGEDLLFAEQMNGSEPSGTVAATGGVRTVWRPGTDDAETSSPMTIAAERVDYDRGRGEIVYAGGVTARQLERELAAERVRVELDSEQRARRMVASGAVRIVDRAQGRTVQGVEAVHDLTEETILVTGNPVVLAEREGTSVRGRRLLYDLAAGTARMLAEGEGAS